MDWAAALTLAASAFALLLALRRLIRRYRRATRETEHAELFEVPAEVFGRTTTAFLLLAALAIGAQVLAIGERAQRVASSALLIALFWQVGLWATAAAGVWLERKRLRSLTADRAALSSLSAFGLLIKGAVWAFVLLLTLDNLGVDITALVAGLGIGGVAVALATQNILGDLFASLSIALDRPFVVGDFLAVGDFLGTVESIGIKSTRLRSLGGEQIVASNADLLASRVRNYGRMAERRVVLKTGIAYETPVEQVERLPELIRGIVEAQPDVRFDRAHFVGHGDVSLDFETVYYVLSPDYNRHMDIQQAIGLRLHRELARRNVAFAYPTQRLLLERAVRSAA
jgi:small-conductance mechanosensitive channel